MTGRIQYICKEEGLSIDDTVVDALLKYSNGDLRKAINYLQSAQQLSGGAITTSEIIAIAGVHHFVYIYLLNGNSNVVYLIGCAI